MNVDMVYGRDCFGRTPVAKPCRSKVLSVSKAHGVVADAVSISGQCGVFR